MIDDIFIFDSVIHVYDPSDENTIPRPEAEAGRQSMLAIGGSLRWPGYHDDGQRFDKRWTVEEIYDMVFVKAPTDMAMAQVVPIFDWFEDSSRPSPHSMRWRSAGVPGGVSSAGAASRPERIPFRRRVPRGPRRDDAERKAMRAASLFTTEGAKPMTGAASGVPRAARRPSATAPEGTR